MAVLYIYNEKGFLIGFHEGDASIANSTDQVPLYTDGYTPQFLNGAWVDQSRPPEVSPDTFKMLFTPAEENAIKKFVNGDPAADPPIDVNEDIATWWGRLASPTLKTVDLSLASVRGALEGLVALGALGAGRVAEILTGKLR